MNILHEIMERSREELKSEKKQFPPCELECAARNRPVPFDFIIPFRQKERTAVIAELKKASPSKGMIRENFQPELLARELEENGAAALSVLTEKNYFLGCKKTLQTLSAFAKIPLLRKDFLYDPYQIAESRLLGASAILLIAAALEKSQFLELTASAKEWGLRILGEAHNEMELDTVLESGADLIGINARDLTTFETSLERSAGLLRLVPKDRIAVAESAIGGKRDIEILKEAGATGFLIGELLMRSRSPGSALKEIL